MKLTDLFEMSWYQFNSLQRRLTDMFKDLGMRVKLSDHFYDRVSDQGRDRDVTPKEIEDVFLKIHHKYFEMFKHAKDDHVKFEAVLKDFAHQLNIPVVINFSETGPRYQLIGLTIMRKDPSRFIPNNPTNTELPV